MKGIGNITVIGAKDFKFARGFVMPDDLNIEDKQLNIVKWGKNNLMPNFLNHIFYSSAYQSGIIRGKVHYLCGSGWTPRVGTSDEIDSFFGSWNCQDVLEMIFKDYELYNGFALRIIQNIEGKRTLEHIDLDMIRMSLDGSGWWYSEDWSKDKQSEEETGLKFYPNFKNNNSQFDSIYVYLEKPKNKAITRSRKDARNVYPDPVYIGALKSLMTDVEIQSFHLYNIMNGMKLSGILDFPTGEPENKTVFEFQVQEALTPTENAGGILINYSNGGEQRPVFIPLSNEDLDKRYLTLETSVVQNILTGHSVTSPMLFGIKTSSQLGGTTEIEDSFNIFVRTYVRARQTTIESHVNYLLNGLEININEPNPLKNNDKNTIVETKKEQLKDGYERVIERLLSCGRDKSEFTFLAKNFITSEDFDFETTEKSLTESYLQFAITDLESIILDMVRRGEKLDGIVEALDEDSEIVKKAYQNLIVNGLIVDGEITVMGVRELAQNQPEIKLEVVYTYELRPNAPALKGESRPFCKALMASNKVFTRSEIDQISAEEGRDVWFRRGGWYSDPTKPRPTPFCRHIWVQQLVINRN